jgi:hypothetical protein
VPSGNIKTLLTLHHDPYKENTFIWDGVEIVYPSLIRGPSQLYKSVSVFKPQAWINLNLI